MDNNRTKGIGHQLKGALWEGIGRLIGDVKLTADGAAERAAGAAQTAASADEDPFIGVNTDRIMGVGHQFIGAAREGLGNITKDRELKASGISERQTGIIQNAASSARDEAQATMRG